MSDSDLLGPGFALLIFSEISRDPSGELSGINLYGYLVNNSINALMDTGSKVHHHSNKMSQPAKLEFSAILGVVITIVRTRKMYAALPLLLQILHFIYMGVFAVIGADGLYFFLAIFLRHRECVKCFSNPNPFGLAPSSVVDIGYLFASLGVLLFFAAFGLGDLKIWGRRVIMRLSLPYCILYFGMVLTAGNFFHTETEVRIADALTLCLSLFSISAMIFYGSNAVNKKLHFR